MKIVSFKIGKSLYDFGFREECPEYELFNGKEIPLPSYIQAWNWLSNHGIHIDIKHYKTGEVMAVPVECDNEFCGDTIEEAIIKALDYIFSYESMLLISKIKQ